MEPSGVVRNRIADGSEEPLTVPESTRHLRHSRLDNGSDDGTSELVSKYVGKGIVA
jgi:hypothetical protein